MLFLDLPQRYDLIFSAFPAPLVSQAKGMTNEREAAFFLDFGSYSRIHGTSTLTSHLIRSMFIGFAIPITFEKE
jgi:hypothetical protein